MARVLSFILLALVGSFFLAKSTDAYSTGSCIAEAKVLVKVLDSKPRTYGIISREFKKLIANVEAGLDVVEFYDSTLLLPTNHALAAAKINPRRIRYNETLYRNHILEGQIDDITTSKGDVAATTNPGVSVLISRAPVAPLKVAIRIVRSPRPRSVVLAHLHTGTDNCFEAYGINRVLF